MHHVMKKAASIWSKIDRHYRNPADHIEVKRPDDQRDGYLCQDELRSLKKAAACEAVPESTRAINKTFPV